MSDSKKNTTAPYPSKSVNKRHRVRRFVFTLNNYTSEELEAIKEIPCKWMVVGKEIGESTATPHLQGAVVLHTQKEFSNLKTLPGLERAWFQEMQGTPAQSLAYCTKQDSSFFTKGTIPQQGKRNDLVDVVNDVRVGKSLREIADSDSGAVAILRYSKGLNVLRDLYRPHQRVAPIICWFYGPTGTGKTRCAFELCARIKCSFSFPWVSTGSVKWFDGYDGQRCAIFDDLRAKQTDFAFLLRLLDRYPLAVEIKGGFTSWRPEFIFVTAPMSPRDMWSFRSNEQIEQLERRIHYCIEFKESPPLPRKLFNSLGLGDSDRRSFRSSVADLWPHHIPEFCGSSETEDPETTEVAVHVDVGGDDVNNEGEERVSQASPKDTWFDSDNEFIPLSPWSM